MEGTMYRVVYLNLVYMDSFSERQTGYGCVWWHAKYKVWLRCYPESIH
jgi:hypothetical protein